VARIVLESVQELLLKLALQMARDDYETRRERQRQGVQLAKTAGKPAMLAEPPDIPWLAVHLLPTIATLPPGTLPVLGDLERCLAWALIKSE
jgi:hypothetical protein